MEWIRSGQGPWGEDLLLGIGADLVWLAVVASALFVVAHAALVKARGDRRAAVGPAPEPADAPPGVPERVVRHGLGARVFHWTMALAMVALLVTAFAPVLGLEFAWVTPHWVAGLLLAAALVWHVIHVLGWQDLGTMVVRRAEIPGAIEELKHALGVGTGRAPRAAKYGVDHKLYHHVAAAAALVATATGLLMMVRVETPLWAPNPYLLSDGQWGAVYVLHGLAGVALIGLVTAHVYFALRPEKRWMTWGMIHGWITRERYLAHHDPARWAVKGDEA